MNNREERQEDEGPETDSRARCAPETDQSLSAEELSAAFAKMLGDDAQSFQEGQPPPNESPDEPSSDATAAKEVASEADEADEAGEHCDVSPLSILEAMLFVGRPDNEPMTSQQVAALMRGVQTREIETLVAQLNAQYDERGCPYHVHSQGAGYRMMLREEHANLRDKFYGRVKEARLSQTALDVLAIIAYRQGLSRQDIDDLRGHPTGAVLSQLVRRQLLRVERPADQPRQMNYFTTVRFLHLFGLESLTELPQAHDLERML